MVTLCSHTNILLDASSHVSQTRYKRATEERRIAAAQTSGRVPKNLKSAAVSSGTFPGPLVLPGDELAEDPRYPPQSLRSFLNGNHRNPLTKNRQTLYVVAPPEISDQASFMQRWSVPSNRGKSSTSRTIKGSSPTISHPAVADVVGFLEAFFHGLPVRLLNQSWRFAPWEDGTKIQRTSGEGAVGLEMADSAIRIRTRPSLDGCFEQQLNLLDLLDACIESVPLDAYAVVLLVEQDMFEDDNDDFCCGRAYGGSRVAVVSTARYHPGLDGFQDVDREHAWPASHCADYASRLCKKATTAKAQPAPTVHMGGSHPPAIQAAIEAHSALQKVAQSEEILQGLWLGRVCKTVAHELGHCLGIDHCTYYACLMQGTANISEDARQPPFLCPVDLAKYMAVTRAREQARDEALLSYCLTKTEVQLFAAYAAWLRIRLMETHAS